MVQSSSAEKLLSWEDVEEAANLAFDVWLHRRERVWAKQTWEAFSQAGLTRYANELQRHVVVVRFLVLGGLFRDFCALAWDERDDPWYSDWAGSLELQDFVIGQLVGPDSNVEDADSGLNHVICKSRPEIVRALIEVFGDEEELFASLWRINETVVEPVLPKDKSATP